MNFGRIKVCELVFTLLREHWSNNEAHILRIEPLKHCFLIDLTEIRYSKLFILIHQVHVRHIDVLLWPIIRRGIILIGYSLSIDLLWLVTHGFRLVFFDSNGFPRLSIAKDLNLFLVPSAFPTTDQVRVECLNFIMGQSAWDEEFLMSNHHMLYVLLELTHHRVHEELSLQELLFLYGTVEKSLELQIPEEIALILPSKEVIIKVLSKVFSYLFESVWMLVE